VTVALLSASDRRQRSQRRRVRRGVLPIPARDWLHGRARLHSRWLRGWRARDQPGSATPRCSSQSVSRQRTSATARTARGTANSNLCIQADATKSPVIIGFLCERARRTNLPTREKGARWFDRQRPCRNDQFWCGGSCCASYGTVAVAGLAAVRARVIRKARYSVPVCWSSSRARLGVRADSDWVADEDERGVEGPGWRRPGARLLRLRRSTISSPAAATDHSAERPRNASGISCRRRGEARTRVPESARYVGLALALAGSYRARFATSLLTQDRLDG
jgi:hypothetical protein